MRKLALLLALIPAFALADIAGKVVGVSDGDTITVLAADNKTYKVRLAGIDAPEKGQPYGQAAKKELSDAIYGKPVTVEGNKLDRYGRLVGTVKYEGWDTNWILIRHGLAWHYKQYERDQSPEDRMGYAKAEQDARAEKLRIWEDPNPIPPWEFRKAKRQR